MKTIVITVDEYWQSPRPNAHGWMPAEYDTGWVSVILPAFNREAFVGEAIASVIAQTYRPIELIVVDDGSTDATAAVAMDALQPSISDPLFHSIIVRQPNRGASAARNQGLMRSHGEFIQYLDSDDVLILTKLADHVSALSIDFELDIVGSDWKVVESRSLSAALAAVNREASSRGVDKVSAVCTERMLPWEPWPLLYRRRYVVAHQPWNERVSRWDDWEYVLRLYRQPPRLAWMPGVYCLQRRHDRGQRQDYDHCHEGVELGLIACREARAACQKASCEPCIRQLVAIRYWETGLEALLQGTALQAEEAFGGAWEIAITPRFKWKSATFLTILRYLGFHTAKYFLHTIRKMNLKKH